MDLSTRYLGFDLPHPLIPGASPLVDDLGMVRRLEDAGAPMIVMHSLFEEQIVSEQIAISRSMLDHEDSFGEATSFLPALADFTLGPHEYLDLVRRTKDAVSVPVVGSLNGTSDGGWIEYARLIEQAGADALELNIYELAVDLEEPGQAVETRDLEVARQVKEAVGIPVAVKLSPFYSSIANFAKKLDEIGIDGLVLFNRFYQPDLDLEQLEVMRVNLSSPAELLLRLRWIAVLSGRLRTDLAVTGGVHTAMDALKGIFAGAHAIQMVSSLLQRGPEHLKVVREGMARWLEEHEYESLRQAQGSLNWLRSPDPKAYERANYIKILQSWRSI